MTQQVRIILEMSSKMGRWVYARDLVPLGLCSKSFERLRKEGVIELAKDEQGYTLVRLTESKSK